VMGRDAAERDAERPGCESATPRLVA
jgi:hypothetical protein